MSYGLHGLSKLRRLPVTSAARLGRHGDRCRSLDCDLGAATECMTRGGAHEEAPARRSSISEYALVGITGMESCPGMLDALAPRDVPIRRLQPDAIAQCYNAGPVQHQMALISGFLYRYLLNTKDELSALLPKIDRPVQAAILPSSS
jgi:hypothetical protein